MRPDYETTRSSIVTALRNRLRRASNEEEVRLAWVGALETSLGIEFGAERGNRDLSYNNVVIEFKGPNKFRGSTTSPAFVEALQDRLLPYIQRTSQRETIPASDYIGIAIDSAHLAFAQVLDNRIIHQTLLPFTSRSFGLVVEACRRSYRRALTGPNLIEDFGHDSRYGTPLLRVLDTAFTEATSNQKVQMLFAEWRTLYGQVADLSAKELDNINGTLLHLAPAATREEVSARLFVIHTFHSLLTKLLAAEIVAAHGLASARTFADGLLEIADDGRFLQQLDRDIEHGQFFESNNIYGFVEEAIFSWYLSTGTNQKKRHALAEGIKDALGALSLYRMDTLDQMQSRDVLRDFYQNLVPQVLRKSLGEFYTPDWLVEFTCDRLGDISWTTTRVLDPTCGSGSFLVEVIRRKRAAAAQADLSPSEALNMIVQSVWGFDLNPLAVQVARTNFLMAIADLLQEVPGHALEVPVLLADAVYSPAPLPESDQGVVKYEIGSDIADLTVLLPAALAWDRTTLDKVLEVMGDNVERGRRYEDCANSLARRALVTSETARQWARPLEFTYNQVLALHRKNWNGIWFRIVRNFFWSATAGEFNLVLGNPPWVRWSKLPEAYRERAKPTCDQYDIFSSTPHHGGNELDISGMITYTTADKWLAENGTLAFVITQTHFQSASSEGFRRFRINQTYHLTPVSVDDMKALKPFPEAANRTSVAVFRKTTAAPRYPVNYQVWRPQKGHRRAIPADVAQHAVLETIAAETHEATPVGEPGTPWAVLRPGRFKKLSRIRGRSSHIQGRKGITTDLNGIYFVEVEASNASNGLVRIRTRPQAGKRNIGTARAFWIEPELLYPLLKGAGDIETCRIRTAHELVALVPNRGISGEALRRAEERMDERYPRTRRYLRCYEEQLRTRSTWANRMPGAPFYAVYNVGTYTFAPFKVVWAEQSGVFKAAVAERRTTAFGGRRPCVPDHKVFFVAFTTAEPAYFLCGLLTAEVVAEFIEGHNIAIQVGNIFKHMNLPAFCAEEAGHRELARLVRQAHRRDDDGGRRALVEEIQRRADEILLSGRRRDRRRQP